MFLPRPDLKLPVGGGSGQRFFPCTRSGGQLALNRRGRLSQDIHLGLVQDTALLQESHQAISGCFDESLDVGIQ